MAGRESSRRSPSRPSRGLRPRRSAGSGAGWPRRAVRGSWPALAPPVTARAIDDFVLRATIARSSRTHSQQAPTRTMSSRGDSGGRITSKLGVTCPLATPSTAPRATAATQPTVPAAKPGTYPSTSPPARLEAPRSKRAREGLGRAPRTRPATRELRVELGERPGPRVTPDRRVCEGVEIGPHELTLPAQHAQIEPGHQHGLERSLVEVDLPGEPLCSLRGAGGLPGSPSVRSGARRRRPPGTSGQCERAPRSPRRRRPPARGDRGWRSAGRCARRPAGRTPNATSSAWARSGTTSMCEIAGIAACATGRRPRGSR